MDDEAKDHSLQQQVFWKTNELKIEDKIWHAKWLKGNKVEEVVITAEVDRTSMEYESMDGAEASAWQLHSFIICNSKIIIQF